MVGAFLAAGPNVRPGKLPRADVYDLARTLLWLQGAPISRELLGRELVELMEPEWVESNPPIYVDSYSDLERSWQQAAEPASDGGVDAQRLKELEALGYLTAGGRHSVADVARAEPAEETTEAKPTALLNRAILARKRGDAEAAIAMLEEAIELRPGFMFAMLELYGIHADRGDAPQALRWLGKALLTDSPRLPPELPVAFVRAAIAAGRLEGAFEILEQMPARWLESSSYHAARALALRDLGRLDEALPELQASLARNPADLDALAIVLEGAAVDQRVAVDPLLEPAFAALRTDLDGLGSLARLCLRHGQNAWAERLLRDVLDSAPTDTPALLALGRALAALGRHEEARASYARARELGLEGPELDAAEAAVTPSP